MQRTPEQRRILNAERAADGLLAMAEYRAAEVQRRKQAERLRAERLARKPAEEPVVVVAEAPKPSRRREELVVAEAPKPARPRKVTLKRPAKA